MAISLGILTQHFQTNPYKVRLKSLKKWRLGSTHHQPHRNVRTLSSGSPRFSKSYGSPIWTGSLQKSNMACWKIMNKTSKKPPFSAGISHHVPSGKRLHNELENRHVKWENPLFLKAIFNSYFDITRGYHPCLMTPKCRNFPGTLLGTPKSDVSDVKAPNPGRTWPDAPLRRRQSSSPAWSREAIRAHIHRKETDMKMEWKFEGHGTLDLQYSLFKQYALNR